MVHIYTFCDKTLVGRLENLSAKFLCENLYKLNFRIHEVCTYCFKYDFESINFKNKDIYFLLMQKSSSTLNSFLAYIQGIELSENSLLKKAVEEYYKNSNIPQDKDASLEWIIPSNATAITNPNGKTQGYLVKIGETDIFVLPNNYLELTAIYNDCVIDYLEKNYPINYKSETFKTFGLNEDYIRSVLKDDIKNKVGVHITIFSKGLDNDVVIKAKEDNQNFEDYRRNVYSKLEKYIYSVQGLSLKQKLEKEILNQNISMSFVGDLSITMLLSEFDVKLQANIFNSYVLSNKNSIASFLSSTVSVYSAEIAYDIAVKALEKSKSDLILVCLCNIEETGRGETFIAIGNKLKIDIYRNKFSGSNKEILSSVSQTSMFYLLKRLMQRDLKMV